jgi:hypothetical protein
MPRSLQKPKIEKYLPLFGVTHEVIATRKIQKGEKREFI